MVRFDTLVSLAAALLTHKLHLFTDQTFGAPLKLCLIFQHKCVVM